MAFSVGDKVIAHRPETEKERKIYPKWIINMDEYDKLILTIREIVRNDMGTFYVLERCPYSFRKEWLSLYKPSVPEKYKSRYQEGKRRLRLPRRL